MTRAFPIACSECGIPLASHPCNWCIPTGRAATRLGRYLLFPGGNVVRLTRREQLLYALGLRTTFNPNRKESR